MIKNSLILFDCFGVLFSSFLPEWFFKYFSYEESINLFHYYCPKGDLGEITLDVAAQELIDKHGIKGKNKEEIIKEFLDIAKPNYELINIIQELRKNNNKVAIVSNAWFDEIEMLLNHYNLSQNLFDHIFISAHYKIKKPDPLFYKKAIEFFHFKPESIYMFDDHESSMTNIEQIGITPIVFKDNNSVKKIL